MALTVAERAKRHREKLKNNPDKFEEHKKKHAALVKSKSKKINELTEHEKEKRRQKWREQKRKQKENKKEDHKKVENKKSNTKLPTKQINERKRNNKYNNLAKKYKTALKRIQVLTTSLQTTKKRLYRLNIHSLKKIRDLETKIDKMKAREEVLECTLKNAYKNSKTNNQKRIYKRLVEIDTVKKAKKKTFVAKLLGLKGRIRIRKEKFKNNEISDKIEKFFIRDDISRCTAGKRECRTLNKKKEQIRYLTDTLVNLYKIYKSEGGEYSLATFYKYKPFYVISPTVQNRNTCLCVKHENFEMMFKALVKNGVLPNCKTLNDVITNVSCNKLSYQCMHGECKECKNKVPDYILKDNQINTQTQWFQWERKDHSYKINENGAEKSVKTKITAKVTKKGTVGTLIKCFEESIAPFKKHYYTWKHQQQKYKECVQELKENEALILCDFSENYTCKLAEEIQSMHFGASQHQITLHTGMVYFADRSKSFCTISDNNCHQPAGIWAHLIPVIKMIREIKPGVNVIHVYSDGPSSQYRQKKNFYLLNLFALKLKLDYATWSFTESGHGKGVADGIGGKAKRILDQQVSYGRDIADGSEAYDVLNKCMPSTKCFYIADSEIDNINKLIPNNLDTVAGTMKIHQIISTTKNKIQHRTHTCFCGTNRGLCDCFSPQTHIFNQKNTKVSKLHTGSVKSSSESIPMRSVTEDVEVLYKTTTSCETHDTNVVLKKSSEPKITNFTDSNVEVEVVDDELYEVNQNNIIEIEADTECFVEPVEKEFVITIHNDHEINAPPVICEKIDNEKLIEINENDIVKMEVDSARYEETLVERLLGNSLCSEGCSLKDKKEIPNDPLKAVELNVNDLQIIVPTEKKCTMKRSKAINNENQSKPKKKKSSIISKKENDQLKDVNRATKSLRTIVTRTLECDRCKKKLPISSCMIKCIVCKKWICPHCSSNFKNFDYICDTCFGE